MTLRRPGLPARAAGAPAGRARLRASRATGGGATPCASPRRRCSPGSPAASRGCAASSRRRCSPAAAACSRSRSPSRGDGRGAGREGVGRARHRRVRARCRRPTSTRRGSRPRSRRRETFLDQVPEVAAGRLRRVLVADERGRRADARPRRGEDRAREPARRRRHRDRRRARARRSTASRRAAARTASRAPAAVILLSDGKRTEGSDPLEAARSAPSSSASRSRPSRSAPPRARCSAPTGEADPRPARPARRCRRSAASPAARSPRRPTPARSTSVYKKLGSKDRHQARQAARSARASPRRACVLLLAGLGTGLRWRGRLP